MKLEQKLFFSSFLRYMIVSNLKLNYTAWAFILSQWGFNSLQQSAMSISQFLLIFLQVSFNVCIELAMHNSRTKPQGYEGSPHEQGRARRADSLVRMRSVFFAWSQKLGDNDDE